ncbi:hypothetical protein [Chitinophaga agri]|nr:hypothetical protein [Chitinophaga agri]
MEKFEILLYSVPEGRATIEVFFEAETFWLSQKKCQTSKNKRKDQ